MAPLDKVHIKTNCTWVSSFPDYHNPVIRRAAVLPHTQDVKMKSLQLYTQRRRKTPNHGLVRFHGRNCLEGKGKRLNGSRNVADVFLHCVP